MIFVGAGAGALVLVGVIAMAMMDGGDNAPAPDPMDVAQNETPETSGSDSGHLPADDPSPENTAPVTEPAAPGDAFAGVPSGDFWVVLSNLSVNRQGLGTGISINYRVASGRPQPGKKYVLMVIAPGIAGDSFIEYDEFTMQSSGTIQFQAAPNFSMTGTGTIRAYMGYSKGFREWEKVSGEVTPGQTSASERPSGKVSGVLVALTNAKLSSRIGPKSVSVDVLVQGQLVAGKRYFLTITGSRPTEAWQIEIGNDLRTAQGPGPKTISGQIFGYVGRGALKLAVEERDPTSFPGRGPAPKVVSNTLNVQ